MANVLFKVGAARTATREVTLKVPADDGIAVDDVKVRITFDLLKHSAIDALRETAFARVVRDDGMGDAQYLALVEARERRTSRFARDFLAQVIVGWPAPGSGLGDADGQPLPFSDAALKALLDEPLFTAAAERAYAELMEGLRQGN